MHPLAAAAVFLSIGMAASVLRQSSFLGRCTIHQQPCYRNNRSGNHSALSGTYKNPLFKISVEGLDDRSDRSGNTCRNKSFSFSRQSGDADIISANSAAAARRCSSRSGIETNCPALRCSHLYHTYRLYYCRRPFSYRIYRKLELEPYHDMCNRSCFDCTGYSQKTSIPCSYGNQHSFHNSCCHSGSGNSSPRNNCSNAACNSRCAGCQKNKPRTQNYGSGRSRARNRIPLLFNHNGTDSKSG